MASLSSPFYSCAFVLLLNFLACPCSKVGGVEAASPHVVSVQSLLPKDVCTPSTESDPTKLEVVHRYGPCSPLARKRAPTHKQILKNDQIRVDWIYGEAAAAAATLESKRGGRGSDGSLAATMIPAQRGIALGTGNYIVNVGFGTPKVAQTVVFDTGSDVTWIQCQPCAASCYQQQDQLFDPTKSSTYANISCSSPDCSALQTSGCSGSTCIYAVQYGDNSQTVGFYAQDTLTLAPSDVIPNFKFGCGEKNSGLFGRAAGLIGLGRRSVSLVSQTAQKYGGAFSYCLPATSSSAGYLTFGSASASNAQFTPMLSIWQSHILLPGAHVHLRQRAEARDIARIVLKRRRDHRFWHGDHPAATHGLLAAAHSVQGRDEAVPNCARSLNSGHMLRSEKLLDSEHTESGVAVPGGYDGS